MRQPWHRRKIGKIGAAPGTLVHIGEQKLDRVHFDLVAYDESGISEFAAASIEDALAWCDGPRYFWLNIDGLHDPDLIERVGRHFNIHPLTLEDILNTAQRPKWEDFQHYIYVVLRMLRLDSSNTNILSEQVSLIITPRVLLSFQESRGDVFAPVRDRLHKGKGRIHKNGSDYLGYALIDAVVDHYFIILDRLGDEIMELEEETLAVPGADLLKRLHGLRGEIVSLRKHIWPLREVIMGMSKQGPPLIADNTTLFLRDVHDHTIQVIDTIESYRDQLSSLLDLYLTTMSNKMNEVMKVLTIMASIFIPLTFIVGVYGMNFEYMPELAWPWAYGVIWSIMVALAVSMVVYFKKKNWI